MSPVEVPDLVLSCWLIEAARSHVLTERGNRDFGPAAAERARLLAAQCFHQGTKIEPRLASSHAAWMADVAGPLNETGMVGFIFLQRLGMYVDSHVQDYVSPDVHRRMRELAEPEKQAVSSALASGELLDVPPPAEPWPAGEDPTGCAFAVIADPHVDGSAEGDDECAAGAFADASDRAAFTVVPGDITKDGGLQSYEAARRIMTSSRVPVIPTMGNHDVAASQGEPAPGPSRFASVFGTNPYAVHEAAGARAIVLNSAVPAVSPFAPFDILGGDFTDRPAEAVPWGTFSDEQLAWMSELGPASDPDTLTFIFVHQPPHPYLGFPPLVFGLDRPSTEQLAGLAERSGARAVFCGHTHRSALSGLGSIPVIEVPSVRHWPFGYALVRIFGGGWSFKLRRVPGAPAPAESDFAGWIFRRYAAGAGSVFEYIGPPRPESAP